MKTLTMVFNFVLLGLIGLSAMTDSLPNEKYALILAFMTLGITIMNVVINAGISYNPDWSKRKEKSNGSISRFMIVKQLAVGLNVLAIAYIFWFTHNKLPRYPGVAQDIIILLILIAIFLSMLRIAVGRWDNFKGLKRTAILTGSTLLILLLTGVISMLIMIGDGIKERIKIAKTEHPGKAEDALLAYLSDSTKTFNERSDVAVWTLGQIKSRKALPVLKSLYKNNPNYQCNHRTELCQYGIYKAIISIERGWRGDKEKKVFGLWTRLNK
ncbi:MAG: HEAT repeat domain-containing protein [Methanosarcina sp.]